MLQPVVAVIGAGFSGTLLSLRLRTIVPPEARIVLIERSGQFGPGLAYGAAGPHHLLNVPAGRMSPFPTQPDDFMRWLRQTRATPFDVAETSFVPRRLYGDYLAHLVNRHSHDHQLEFLADQVVSIDPIAGGVGLQLASGDRVHAAVAVLATGNGSPQAPILNATGLRAKSLWFDDPWAPLALARLHHEASVLLIGTGLTMIDAVTTLMAAGHTGPIRALSRHGLLPRPHASTGTPAFTSPPPPRDLSGLLHWLRLEAGRAVAGGRPWQSVIDSLRPITQTLWRGFSDAERRRFLRHLRTYWDVHRHRLPQQVAGRIASAQHSGQLQVLAGRLVDVTDEGDHAAVTWRPRGSEGLVACRANRIVNCTGAGKNILRSEDVLMRTLVSDGVVRPSPLGLGLDVTMEGTVRSRAGTPNRHLYAIGPLTQGAWWEITSVPDIRQQCETLAATIAGLLHETLSAAQGMSPRFEGARLAEDYPYDNTVQ